MSRGKRILTDNSYYHIINRGNKKDSIFLHQSDYQKYIDILKHCKKKYAVGLFGYCLMPNHVHLILEIRSPSNLAKFMQSLTQTYTKYFNEKYSRVGHLWQGRFKSMNIEKNVYFIECVYYVEANPVRAKLVSSPINYPWSSYRSRVLGKNDGLLDLPDST